MGFRTHDNRNHNPGTCAKNSSTYAQFVEDSTLWQAAPVLEAIGHLLQKNSIFWREAHFPEELRKAYSFQIRDTCFGRIPPFVLYVDMRHRQAASSRTGVTIIASGATRGFLGR